MTVGKRFNILGQTDRFDGKEIFFNIMSSLTAILFFHIGHVSKTSINKLRQQKICVLLMIGSVSFVLTFGLSNLSTCNLELAANKLPEDPALTICTALLGCLTIMILADLLDKVRYLQKIIAYFGYNSLIIMGVHSEIRVVCYFIMDHIGMQATEKNAWIVFVITVIICGPIIYCIRKSFPLLVGGK